jgi:hypothetical protein
MERARVDDMAARRFFSAWGIWRARMASSFSTVMPGRASARRRCSATSTSGHDDDVEPVVEAVFEQQRNIDHRERRAVASALAKKSAISARTSGWTSASSWRSFSGRREPALRALRSTFPPVVTPGKSARWAALPRLHRAGARLRLRKTWGCRSVGEHREDRRLAGGDRAGEADPQHQSVASISLRSSA